MKNYITYELWNPITNEPFYVGAGTSKRPYHHIRDSKNPKKHSHKIHTIRQILRENKNPEIRIIFTGGRKDAFDLEVILIARYGRADLGKGPLTNLTDGGDGGTPGFRDGVETRKRKSLARQGSLNPMHNKNHSAESRSLIKNNHHDCSGMNNSRAKQWKLVLADNSEILIKGNLIEECKTRKIDFSCLLNTIKTGIPLKKGKGKGCMLFDLGRI